MKHTLSCVFMVRAAWLKEQGRQKSRRLPRQYRPLVLLSDFFFSQKFLRINFPHSHLWKTGIVFCFHVRVRGSYSVREKEPVCPRLTTRLIRLDRPLVILPNLAIHLQTAEEVAAFKINKVILCTGVRGRSGRRGRENWFSSF